MVKLYDRYGDPVGIVGLPKTAARLEKLLETSPVSEAEMQDNLQNGRPKMAKAVMRDRWAILVKPKGRK